MTTLHPEPWRCVMCEQVSEQLLIASTNELTPGDLDLRPGEMLRSTMAHWVIRCPSCGYVADEGAEEETAFNDMITDPRELIASQGYRERLEDPAYPTLANEFRCRALLEESVRLFAGAGWWELRAAWACDDEGERAAAKRCRERALCQWYWAEENRQEIAEDAPSSQLLVADLLRRVGAQELAAERCRRGLSGRPGEPVRSLLEFELELIGAGDEAAHSVAEASIGGSP